MSFEIFVRVFFLVLLAISYLVGRRVVAWVTAYGNDDRAKRRIRIGAWAAWLFLNLPSIYFIIRGRSAEGSAHHVWYSFFLYPYFAWLTTSLALAVVLAAKGLVMLPARIRRWWRRRHGARRVMDLQRRDFLAKGATALPAALLLTSGYGIVRAQADFVWYEPEIKLKDWPRELEGLRILQISDIHVGHFMPGDKLKRFIADINRRSCDILVVTGDIVDHNMAWFPECMEAMATLELPPRGAYVCIGNHDYYSRGAEEILAGMRRLGMTVVRDSHVPVPIGNSKVTLAGIDYPVWAPPGAGGRTFNNHVKTALAGRDPDAPVILLAHHPHAFDEAAVQGVQLTLSGHTHGGQFALHYGDGKAVSIGDLMFKYVAGSYAQNGSQLYVNRGIGNWFPMRLGAPPEATLITVG
jgi:hypothetical protein